MLQKCSSYCYCILFCYLVTGLLLSDRFVCSNDYPESEFTQRLERLFKEGQYGTRCMDPSIYEISDTPCMAGLATSWTNQRQDIIPNCECETKGTQLLYTIVEWTTPSLLPTVWI